MRLTVASDHAAVELRQAVVSHLRAQGHTVEERGPSSGASADYPDLAGAVGCQVASGEVERGVLICGTGIGMSIAANKVPGVRAALVHDLTTASLAAQHNDANVLCLGGRLLASPLALACVDAWLTTPFEARHQRRLDGISAIERQVQRGLDPQVTPTPSSHPA